MALGNRRLLRYAAVALAVAGGIFLLYACVLALQGTFSGWGMRKVPGQVVRVVTAQADGRTAPVVAFTDETGKPHTLMMPHVQGTGRLAEGESVSVLYDPREPSQARLTGYAQVFAFPLLLASAGALLLLVAATLSAPPDVLQTLGRRRHVVIDPALLQFHPFNTVAVKHYLAGMGAPEDKRKVRISDAAQALREGRVPVVLAEFLAYASALAYAPEAAQFLATHFPRAGKPARFAKGGAAALSFLHEGHVVIALAETQAARPLGVLRQLFERRAGARDFVPQDTVWDAAARNRTAARAWDGLRDDVEAWIKDAAPDPAFEEEKAGVPYLVTGHGMGGAMAVIAAYEFAKRARRISGVVTFGAPPVVSKAFAEEYRNLGLDLRTLDVRAQRDALPPARWPLSRATPAMMTWSLTPPAGHDGREQRVTRGPVLARLAHGVLNGEEVRGFDAPRGFWRSSLLRLLSAFPQVRTAMLRHDIERRYALALTRLVQDRLSGLLAGEAGAAGSVPAAEAALSEHLLDIRGVRPEDADQVFLTLDHLPAAAAGAGPAA